MLTRHILSNMHIISQLHPNELAQFLLGIATGIAFLLVAFPQFKR